MKVSSMPVAGFAVFNKERLKETEQLEREKKYYTKTEEAITV